MEGDKMEWKKSNFLMIEGESARPGTYTGTDARKTNLTPEFLKNVFKSFNKYQPLYLTHDDDEPMGIITSLGYSEDSDTIYWKGIAFDAEKCERIEKEGFDYFSPNFRIFNNIAKDCEDTPLSGVFTGGALVRNPAIKTNTAKKNWVSFSAPTDDVVASVNNSLPIDIQSTNNVSAVSTNEINASLIDSIISEKLKSINVTSDSIKLPDEIKSPKWVKLDNGGYIIMDETTKISEQMKTPIVQTEKSTSVSTPEQIAQIELAKRNLEEKQNNDQNKITELTTTLEKIRAEYESESDKAKSYKEKFENVIGGEISSIESELRSLGFEKPEEYAKSFEPEVRLKLLDDTKRQLIRKKDVNQPLDIKVENNESTKSIDEMLVELNMPAEYKKYIKN